MNPISPFKRPVFVPEFSDYASFRGHTIGITGQRGILGGILYSRLMQAGIKTEAYPGNVTEQQALDEWFRGKQFSHFFHFAAVVPVTLVEKDPLAAYRANAIGSFEVCRNILLTQKECWFFQSSSSHVYEPTAGLATIAEDGRKKPGTFYGVTKLAAEQIIEPLLEKLKAPYCIGRIFSFSSAKQPEPYLVPSLRRRISELKDGDVLDVNNPSSVRDIQDAETIIDCILHLAQRRAMGAVNIGTGEGMSVRDIALAIARTLDRKIEVTGVDHDAPASLIADTTKLRNVLRQNILT